MEKYRSILMMGICVVCYFSDMTKVWSMVSEQVRYEQEVIDQRLENQRLDNIRVEGERIQRARDAKHDDDRRWEAQHYHH